MPDGATVTYQTKGGTSKFYSARDRENTAGKVEDVENALPKFLRHSATWKHTRVG